MEEYRVKQDPQDYGLADEVFNMEAFKEKLQVVIVRWGDQCRHNVKPKFAKYIAFKGTMKSMAWNSIWSACILPLRMPFVVWCSAKCPAWP